MKGFEGKRSLKALRTFDSTGIRDRLKVERRKRDGASIVLGGVTPSKASQGKPDAGGREAGSIVDSPESGA